MHVVLVCTIRFQQTRSHPRSHNVSEQNLPACLQVSFPGFQVALVMFEVDSLQPLYGSLHFGSGKQGTGGGTSGGYRGL